MLIILRSKWPVAALLFVLALTAGARADVLTDLETAYRAQRDGEHELAVKHLTRIIKSGQLKANEKAVAYLLRGEAYKDDGRYKMAVADFTRALKLQPEYAHALFLRGVSFEKQDMLKDALRDVGKAVDLKPDKEAYRSRLEVIKAKLSGRKNDETDLPR